MTAMPREGEKAPKFTLSRDGGGKVALSDFKGRILILYFYPRADTPGCTKEAIDFSRLVKAFDKAGASVLGVSADPVEASSVSAKSMTSRSRSAPTKTTTCSTPMACGARNRCMGAASWA